MKRFASISYVLSSLGLAVFSYSQVDLNLTLSANSYYQQFQTQLTNLGYFNRPLATWLYLALLVLMMASYLLLLRQALLEKLTLKEVIKLSVFLGAILLFAYPAFSYDIFNYIFDARILLHHGQNPWAYTALDFPDDTWTRFMRWTHRTYPYGPSWLIITLPFYAIGLGKFILTLLSFKVLGLVSYLMCVFSLRYILVKQKIANSSFALSLFALNPLVLIEGLVSVHLDITMSALMLCGVALVLASRKTLGWGTLLVSVAIKYISGALVPFLLAYQFKKINFERMVLLALLGSYVLTLVVISQREILPWYVLVPFGLSSLVMHHKFSSYLVLALTPALLVRYAPFLYVGDYTSWVYQTRNQASVFFFLVSLAIYWLYDRYVQKNV